MTKALIIGGGVAGPVTAIALRKAGIEATIYEAYDRGADGVGAFLTLAVNGLDVLHTLDLHTLIRDKGFDTPRMTFFSGSGKKLGEAANGGTLPDGTVSQTIKRSDLYTTLRDEAVRRGVEVTYGKRLVDAKTTPSGVVAHFADGSQAEGDLLVGADGLQSRTRSIIDPDAPAARYVGLLNTGGYARNVDVDADPKAMTMIFGKHCFFAFTQSPDGEIWWFANPARATEPTRQELAEISATEWRTRLIDLFQQDRSPAAAIIRASTEIVPAWGTYDFPNVPRWHDQRMIIIGDAAHAASPASGQGAAMAMEDAVTLAICLRDQGDQGDIAAAFAQYERLRRARTEAMVAQGKKNGDNKAVGPLGRAVRDLVLPIVFRRQAKKSTGDWMFTHHISWDAPGTPAGVARTPGFGCRAATAKTS